MKKLLLTLLASSLTISPVSLITSCGYTHIDRVSFGMWQVLDIDNTNDKTQLAYQMEEFGIPSVQTISNFLTKHQKSPWEFSNDQNDRDKQNKFFLKDFEISEYNNHDIVLFLEPSDYYKEKYIVQNDGRVIIRLSYKLNKDQSTKLKNEFTNLYKNKKDFDNTISNDDFEKQVNNDVIDTLKQVIYKEMYDYMFTKLDWKKTFKVILKNKVTFFDMFTGLTSSKYSEFQDYLTQDSKNNKLWMPTSIIVEVLYNAVEFGFTEIFEEDKINTKFNFSSIDYEKLAIANEPQEILERDFLNNNDSYSGDINFLLKSVFDNLYFKKNDNKFFLFKHLQYFSDMYLLAKNEVLYSGTNDGEFKSYNKASQEEITQFLANLKSQSKSDVYIKVAPNESNLGFRGETQPIKITIKWEADTE
ncbi:hypothetical protein SHELI_v1c04110 [Spiroplasma helicoides]|uniref:Lipoprotein n=1 Tax=Spiroplasma helicoides TaxID=216938 RepID=A0A1B3SKA3_9MOLU|nr:hypothetical protein [Spiroplasma helicoides]AOG60362.1 hypothetical protein SHELI_v1c04110 [Spiroplasma helicoides]